MSPPLSARAALEQAIEAMIDLLDTIDGDGENEADEDACPDDIGERCGDTFLSLI